MAPRALARDLEARHRRLRDGDVGVELETLDQLLGADGRPETGLDELAGVLVSARRLPAEVVVRVSVAEPGDLAAAEADFRRACSGRARAAWREAVAMRRNGLRDLPLAIATAAGFGALAAAAGYLADAAGSGLPMVICSVVAGIAVIAAWASAWLPIEQALFDWRESAHLADTYDLLARSPVRIVRRATRGTHAAR